MANHRCPWWAGTLLANPVRRLLQDPARILRPYVRPGMTVLEPGPGMGFFTLELARLAGPSGRVVAIDVQPQMLEGLKRRAAKAGLAERVEARRAQPQSLGVGNLAGQVDFVLVFAMLHEMPSAAAFFAEAGQAMKPGAILLLAEPSGHVNAERFAAELAEAGKAGFSAVERPGVRWSHAAVLRKQA